MSNFQVNKIETRVRLLEPPPEKIQFQLQHQLLNAIPKQAHVSSSLKGTSTRRHLLLDDLTWFIKKLRCWYFLGGSRGKKSTNQVSSLCCGSSRHVVHVDLATLMPLYDYRQRDNLLNYGQRERERDSDCLREWKWWWKRRYIWWRWVARGSLVLLP